MIPTNPNEVMRMISETKSVAKVLIYPNYLLSLSLVHVSPQGMAGVTIFFYLLYLIFPTSESVFAMKATNTYGAHSYVWNLFTAGFYNTNILMVCVVQYNDSKRTRLMRTAKIAGLCVGTYLHCHGSFLVKLGKFRLSSIRDVFKSSCGPVYFYVSNFPVYDVFQL